MSLLHRAATPQRRDESAPGNALKFPGDDHLT